jgi:hypothetical protein
VAVADQVPPDHIRNRRIVIDHDDPSWRVRVVNHDAPGLLMPGTAIRLSLTVTR